MHQCPAGDPAGDLDAAPHGSPATRDDDDDDDGGGWRSPVAERTWSP